MKVLFGPAEAAWVFVRLASLQEGKLCQKRQYVRDLQGLEGSET